MSDHLPEKQVVIDFYNAELGTTHSQMCASLYEKCCQPCHDDFLEALDNLLRACEQRVREDEQASTALEIARKTSEHYAYGRADALTQMLDAGNVMGQEFYSKGYAAALDAARAAVADIFERDYAARKSVADILERDYRMDVYLSMDDCLAAIDALREGKT